MEIITRNHAMSEPPAPGTYYLTFQKQLAASEDIAYLARVLAHVHWKYEGWSRDVPSPMGGQMKQIYEKAACTAVRLCSEPEVQVATSRAERFGLHAIERLVEDVGFADSERGEELIRIFVKQCVDVFRFSLINGVGELAPQEQVMLADMEMDK